MILKRTRPIGITLLAVTFLWIGCVGTLVFPIICLSGGADHLWRFIAGRAVHSEAALKIAGFLFASIWFLLYVAYAFIGFGLWRLRDWARRAIIWINCSASVVCIPVLAFLVKPAPLAVSVIVWAAFWLGGIAFYLHRPRVRFAFGVWKPAADAAIEAPPPGLSKWGITGVVLASLFTLAVFFEGLSIGIASSFRESGLYQAALKAAQESPCFLSIIGAPITQQGSIGGELAENDVSGSGKLVFGIHGPKGAGKIWVAGTKTKGFWKFDSFFLLRGSDRIDLMAGAVCPSK
jgi:hypothetical protein